MDQVDTLDFKALRARFQEEQHLLKPTTMKPTLPEKTPRVISSPQSPTHFLPAGARPSLLSSISLEGRSATAPRVVFKEDKKESKKPLIQLNSKGRDKSEGKAKKGKDKTKGGQEGSVDRKQKNGKEKKLPLLPQEGTAELVPATPPPQATLSKRKGFLVFKKSPKRNSAEVPAEPILDSLSSDGPGPAPLTPAPLIPAPLIPAPLFPAPLTPAPLIPAPLIPAPLFPAPLIPAPLIPAPSDFCDASAEPEPAAPKALLPNLPALPDLEIIPACPDFAPPPALVPDTPAPEEPTPESETPLEIETPSLPVSRPASRNEILPDLADRAVSPRPPAASTPPPSPPELAELAVEEAGIEAVNIAEVKAPPSPASLLPSPKAAHRISALAALSRVEVMNPGKKTSPCDQRIFNALEKARKKISPPANSSTPYSVTPPPEEHPPSPTYSLPQLPPIDYVGNALPSKPVDGFDHRQASPVLEGITEEGSGAVPELLVVAPPSTFKKVLPDPESLVPAHEKPNRPLSANLGQVIPPPPMGGNEMLVADTTDVPEIDAHSRAGWGNGEYAGPDTSDGPSLPELYSNGTTPPGAEVHREPESSFQISQESPPLAGLEGDVDNGVYESTENVYESMPTSATKKKGKSEGGGKKRKGPPKNPYAEAQQETKEEKSRTGRFGKNDKKAAAAAAAAATTTATATATEGPDDKKELKKKEKQRLEKEKKELKEKQEREKKEQKEREKKENEMKKKFKITGQEDAMYQANVTVTNKGRKNDLSVNSGDVVSIIRTTNCPKGKWLARDSSNNCGYIAVDHVELDIKEMLELGKKAGFTRMNTSSNGTEEEVARTASRVSNHYPISAESFSDDSEEWTADDDEPLSPTAEPEYPQVSIGHTRALSMPDMGNKELSVNHGYSRSDISTDGPDVQARHVALQKLATFFHSPKPEEPDASLTEPETSLALVKEEETPILTEPETSPVLVKEEEVPLPGATSTQEVDLDLTDMIILPPPDLYADFNVE